MSEATNKLTILNLDNIEVELKPDVGNETLWGTTKELAKLFAIDETGIAKHIQNIIKDEELQENQTTAKFAVVQKEGNKEVNREVLHYNLDMMIAVGYRVNSKKATEFRKQATQIIKAFITKGIVINENKVTAEEVVKALRKLRTEEKYFYGKIKDVFTEATSDYNVLPREQKNTFFAFVQDKFHFAVTGKTAAQLKLSRANADKENMGLYNFVGNEVSLTDVIVGKNYLDAKEMEEMEILAENFLGFCQLKAFKGQLMSFDEITYKVNQFLEFNGYNAFNKYNQPNAKQVDLFVKEQFKKYKEKIKLEKQTQRQLESKKN